MKYLWIGVGQSAEGKEQTVKNGGQILSDGTSNDALLEGLEKNGVFCDTVNGPRVPPFPAYRQCRLKGYDWQGPSGTECRNVGYLNLKYISVLSKKDAMVAAAKKWARAHQKDEVTVFVYQMHTPFMAAAEAVKEIIPGAKLVLIVPDLPQYMDMNMSPVKQILKKIDWAGMQKRLGKMDRFVLYSRYMADFLGLEKGSWTVMEGAFDPKTVIEEEPQKNDRIVSVMYSGLLEEKYGIPQLLDAFSALPEHYELWFTGSGNAEHLIRDYAERDSRIRFFGYLPSKRDLLKKQKEATMLISTRDPMEEASRYCFPSKLFEYMVSGNPVISTDIAGIPEEYKDYLKILKSLDADEIRSLILGIGSMTAEERAQFGSRARDFVLREKNSFRQAQKLLEL